MNKPNLLVVCPPDHYVLRNLAGVRDSADIYVGNDTEALGRHAPEADVILYSGLTGKTVNFPEVWKHARRVKWVHSLSAGVEKLLFPALMESPVPVTNAKGVFKRSLAEFAVLGMLFFDKRIRRMIESQKAHRWDDFRVGWLPDKVMGVVGYGEIGRECAILAKAMGLKIYAARRNPERSRHDPIVDRVYSSDRINEFLHELDVLLLAAPHTPETHHMISEAAFNAMKRTAIVINVGRGPVIDEKALTQALQEKKIGGAALDVFEVEPLPADSPLWDMENVLISPHCTDRTENPDWLDLAMQPFLENFQRFVKGEPLINIVDKRAGY